MLPFQSICILIHVQKVNMRNVKNKNDWMPKYQHECWSPFGINRYSTNLYIYEFSQSLFKDL